MKAIETLKTVQQYLKGHKTYIVVTICGIVEVLFVFGYITVEQRDALLKLFGGAGVMTMAAKINRAIEEFKKANNIARRSA